MVVKLSFIYADTDIDFYCWFQKHTICFVNVYANFFKILPPLYSNSFALINHRFLRLNKTKITIKKWWWQKIVAVISYVNVKFYLTMTINPKIHLCYVTNFSQGISLGNSSFYNQTFFEQPCMPIFTKRINKQDYPSYERVSFKQLLLHRQSFSLLCFLHKYKCKF